MEMAVGIGVVIIGCLVAHVYFGFALQDSRYPESPPKFGGRLLYAVLLTLVGTAAISHVQLAPEKAAELGAIALGLLVGPAVAPPLYVDKIKEPKLLRRLGVLLWSFFSAEVAKKIAALIFFAICFLFSIDNWYWVAVGISAFLLHAKAAALACAESPVGGSPRPQSIKRWQLRWLVCVLCMCALFSIYVNGVFMDNEIFPSLWSAYGGLGLSALLSMGSAMR